MAWNFQFLDTFAHYTIGEATSKGKWTNGGFTGGTSLEDGLQQANYSNVTWKVFPYALQSDKPQGRIVAVRGSYAFTNATFGTVCSIKDSVTGQEMRLQVNDATGGIRVIGPSGYISPTDTSLGLSAGQLYNWQMACWWNPVSGLVEFEVRIDNIPIAALTVTAGPAVAATPGWDMIQTEPTSAAPCFRNVQWFWTSQYTNAGGKFNSVGNGDFMPNGKRGVQYSDADGLFAGNVGGAKWTSDIGAPNPYFSRINETLVSIANYIKTTFDPNSAPTVLDRASVQMANVNPAITSVYAVQRTTTLHAEVGTGTVRLFTRTKGDANPAALTFDAAITPLSSPTITTKAELVDPRDGAAWTRAKLDSLERGIETFNLT
jgi:hypothetical protein